MAIKEYSKSIEKSKDIMEHFINLLADQGVTHVPIWEPKEGAEEAEKPIGDKLRRKSSAKGRDLEQGTAESTNSASKLGQVKHRHSSTLKSSKKWYKSWPEHEGHLQK